MIHGIPTVSENQKSRNFMNFQFYCPQGHLLQADTAHAGSIIVCPICGTQFIIPAPPPQAVPVATPVVTPVAPVSQPLQQSVQENGLDFTSASSAGRAGGRRGNDLNALLGGGADGNSVEETPEEASPFAMMQEKKEKEMREKAAAEAKKTLTSAMKAPPKAEELSLVHIPCPKGHVLDVDKEMIGQRVQCPVCRAVYDLKLENSLEYIQEKKKAQELEEMRLGKIWIVRAGIAVILVILFLIVMIFSSR